MSSTTPEQVIQLILYYCKAAKIDSFLKFDEWSVHAFMTGRSPHTGWLQSWIYIPSTLNQDSVVTASATGPGRIVW